MAKIIGIDLGSASSSMAVYQGNQVVLIPSAEGSLSTPSVVVRKENSGWLAGNGAQEYAAGHPESNVISVMENADVNAIPALQPLSVFLSKLKMDAEEYLNASVDGAVITVPGWFNLKQRKAIREAASIAGFKYFRPVSVSSAAAVVSTVGFEEDEIILLVDVGASGLSVTAANVGSSICEVLASGGEIQLGGNAFDECIAGYAAEEIRKKYGIDLRSTPAGRRRLKEAAEKAKNELSEARNVRLSVPNPEQFSASGYEISLSREQFEILSRPLVRRIAQCVERILKAAENASSCKCVVLTGGASRIPAVREAVQNATGSGFFLSTQTDTCVVRGAALLAGCMSGEVKDLLMLDALNFSIGLRTEGDVFTRLIDQGNCIPASSTQTFSTAVDNQKTVEICVLQGESEKASENQEIMIFSVTGITPAPRGAPKIEVSINVDGNSCLNVEAKEKESGIQKKVVTLPIFSEAEQKQCQNEVARFISEYSAKSKPCASKVSVDNTPASSAVVPKRQTPLTEETKTFVKELFPVLDNLERAIAAASGSAEIAFRKGVELTYRQLSDILEKRGITAIDRKGQPFDPNLENAVMQGAPDEGEPGTVCEVFQKGYQMEGAVLRYAMVKVVPE